MRVYIIRHGTASHLMEDYDKKLNYSQFVEILESWKKSTLTPLGKEEIAKQVNALQNMYSFIFYSPMKRTQQTAKAFLQNHQDYTHSKSVPQLEEIHISPPLLPNNIKLRLKYWIFLCLLKSVLTLRIFKYYIQARQIIKMIKRVKNDILIISHQARIFSLIVYAFLNPNWKVLKTDFNPAGVCIIEKRGKN